MAAMLAQKQRSNALGALSLDALMTCYLDVLQACFCDEALAVVEAQGPGSAFFIKLRCGCSFQRCLYTVPGEPSSSFS
jgi:hypothetical protein